MQIDKWGGVKGGLHLICMADDNSFTDSKKHICVSSSLWKYDIVKDNYAEIF